MNIYPFISNNSYDVYKLFYEELKFIYSENEIKILFQRIIEHFGYEAKNSINSIYLQQSELIKISKWIDELKDKKPLAYILGYTYFYNLVFFVNQHVLIPRPETEELVFHLRDIVQKELKYPRPLKMIDIGTGSGCIAIVLKKAFPEVEVVAIDKSLDALKAAQENAIYHQVNIHFKQQDILEEEFTEKYDIIVSNPPYIPLKDASTIDKSVRRYEPPVALFSNFVTEFYEKIFHLSQKYLNKDGIIMLEINQYYSKEILDCSKQYPLQCEVIKDWSNNDRFIYCKRI